MELRYCTIQVRLDQGEIRPWGEPLADGRARFAPNGTSSSGGGTTRPQAFIDQDEVQVEFVQLVTATIQVRGASLNRLVCQPLTAWRGLDWWDSPLDQVLV